MAGALTRCRQDGLDATQLVLPGLVDVNDNAAGGRRGDVCILVAAAGGLEWWRVLLVLLVHGGH